MYGFALQYNDDITSNEVRAIMHYCIMHGISYKHIMDISDIPIGYIAVGSVEFCESYLGFSFTPDYYPNFLSSYFHRGVYKCNSLYALNFLLDVSGSIFVKPSDCYKRFNGVVVDSFYSGDYEPPYYCSGVVNFVNEWRYYISNGEVLLGEWYSGDADLMPCAPDLCNLDIKFPCDYCGAVDFGLLDSGEFALVEAHHPFACGWYGKDHNLYAEWIISGWYYLLKVIDMERRL